ncbi:MAG: hypothetical protein R8J85_08970 [Mariprofundales bacterium]
MKYSPKGIDQRMKLTKDVHAGILALNEKLNTFEKKLTEVQSNVTGLTTAIETVQQGIDGRVDARLGIYLLDKLDMSQKNTT